jgi:hypothetical protein
MGKLFTDKFSLLHGASGVVAYYWGMPFIIWFIIHLLFELAENTKLGMNVLNRIHRYPGGKTHSDSIINSVGDQFYGMVGWLIAFAIDDINY